MKNFFKICHSKCASSEVELLKCVPACMRAHVCVAGVIRVLGEGGSIRVLLNWFRGTDKEMYLLERRPAAQGGEVIVGEQRAIEGDS